MMLILSAISFMDATVLIDRLAAGLGVFGGFAGDLVGLPGVVGVLLDARGHLLHRTGALLGGGALFGGALGELLGRGAHFLGAGGDIVRRGGDIPDDLAEVLHHAVERFEGEPDFVPVLDSAVRVRSPSATALANWRPD